MEDRAAAILSLVREYGDRRFREAAALTFGDRAAAEKWAAEAAGLLEAIAAKLAE